MNDNDVIEGTAIAIREEPTAVAEWTPSFVRSVDDQLAMLAERDRFYRTVLKADTHYGVIPGTKGKPTLLKPGAEALLSAMALHTETGNEEPPIVDVTGKDHDGEPFIQYTRWCRIYRQTGRTYMERIEIAKLTGACNSWEPKYRYRKAERVCPRCDKSAIIKGKEQYGGGWVCFKKKDGCGAKFDDNDPAITSQEGGQIANENVLELQNTILKMADKRALIAATLVATGCSDIFTQDIEDMPRTMAAQEPRRVAPKAEPATESAEMVKKRKADGIRRLHIWARDRGIDTESPSSPYRRLLLEHFADVFADPAVEISSKALSLEQLQAFSRALQAWHRDQQTTQSA